MRESELYGPVREWLKQRGYVIHVELFDADVIAVKDGLVTVVELKPCLTETLERQLHKRAEWADFVWAAIGSEPRGFRSLKYHGFGLLIVTGMKVHQKIKAYPQPHQWHKRRAYRIKKLTGREPAMPHELAGLKSCPELRQQRLDRTPR